MIDTSKILHVDIGILGDKESFAPDQKPYGKVSVETSIHKLEREALLIASAYNNTDFGIGFNKFISKIYPQGFTENGEDGILLQLFKEIGVGGKTAIEIGAGDGLKYSVTADLRLNHGWMGYLIDGFVPTSKTITVSKEDAPHLFLHTNGWPVTPDYNIQGGEQKALVILDERSDRTSADSSEKDIDDAVLRNNDSEFSKHSYFIKKIVTKENVKETLSEHKVPEYFDLLTIDIDSIDWYIWKEIGPRARVVMIEYNPNILPNIDAIIKYDASFMNTSKDAYRGSSILALYRLGRSMGYSLVHALNCNLIFVKDEELFNIKTEIPWKNDIPALYAMSSYYFKPYFRNVGRHITVFRSDKYKGDSRKWVSSSSMFLGKAVELNLDFR